MSKYYDGIRQMVVRVLPFLIAATLTIIFFSLLSHYYMATGTVTSKVISVWM